MHGEEMEKVMGAKNDMFETASAMSNFTQELVDEVTMRRSTAGVPTGDVEVKWQKLVASLVDIWISAREMWRGV